MYIKNCSLMRFVQTYSKQYSVIEHRRFMYINNCSLMRMVQTYSKQYSVIEQRRFMYIKKLLFVSGGAGIFKAIFSDRTAEVHVYQK